MNNEKENLKVKLKKIKNNDYNLFEGEKVSDYFDIMLKYLGDADAELRDNLILSTFATWIEEKKYFNNEELYELLNTLLSEDYLFFNIGSEGDDSVLKRSFSALLINPIICAHLFNEAFLDENMISRLKKDLIRYYNEEKDLRGYHEEKGWIHALAHAADSINVLLGCDGIDESFCIQVMSAIKNKLFSGTYFLASEEDDRIINGIYCTMLDDKILNEEYICSWAKDLEKVLETQDKMRKYKARVNARNFIRSLYFRLLHNEYNTKFSENLLETLKEVELKLNVY